MMADVEKMNREDFRQVLVEISGYANEILQDSIEFEKDLGMNPLEMIDFLIAVEEELEIKISDSVSQRIKTVGALLNLLEKKCI